MIIRDGKEDYFLTILDWPDYFLKEIYPKIEIILISTEPDYHITDNICSFHDVTQEEIIKLRNNDNCFLVINWIGEGFITHYRYHDIVTNFCLENNINLDKVFFFTSNLKDEPLYNSWKENNNIKGINVISFNYFEHFSSNKFPPISIDDTVNKIRSCDDKDFKNFLSLNRIKRPYRGSMIYQIFHSTIMPETFISYDKLMYDDILHYITLCGCKDPDEIKIKQLSESSPSVLDFDDFNVNWAPEYPLYLFNKSLISIVSETLHDSYNDGSLFYSEKTFKCIMANHPIIIVGQSGINKHLSEVGYKRYDSYFDLSFDDITDHWTRLESLIFQLEELNEKLKCMTKDEKIKWLLQDIETLEHNKNAVKEYAFTKKGIQKFIDKVTQYIS